MSLCLSRDEIAELTRAQTRRRQVAFLVQNGIRHYVARKCGRASSTVRHMQKFCEPHTQWDCMEAFANDGPRYFYGPQSKKPKWSFSMRRPGLSPANERAERLSARQERMRRKVERRAKPTPPEREDVP